MFSPFATARIARLLAAALVSVSAMPGVSIGQVRRDAPSSFRAERAFPTGDPATSVLLLERSAPDQVRRGEEFTYELRVTNLTRQPLDEVIVTEQFPTRFRVTGISPQPGGDRGGPATWRVARLDGGRAAVFQVRGRCEETVQLDWCATVTLNTGLCSSTRVVEPQITIRKEMPADVLACDDIPIRITVGNPGNGVARGVRVSDTLPPGLLTGDGKNGFLIDVGDLAAGQSREFVVNVRARETGQFRNTAVVREAGGLAAEASAVVRVRKPVLTLSKNSTDFRFLGRPCSFEFVVTNVGDASAIDTVLTDRVPAGLQFVDAEGGGQLTGDAVVWNLGTIEPGASRRVIARFRTGQIGTLRNTAFVRAICAGASAEATLNVRGVPAILLEVVDIHDPIELGADETYEIAVTNQGTAVDTNIVIVATLPPQMDFVSADGPTRAGVSGRTITFAPLPALQPKQRAVFRVVARGNSVADVRFGVSLRSDQTREPVEETESTHVY